MSRGSKEEEKLNLCNLEVLLVISNHIMMLRRLSCAQINNPKLWRNLLNCKSQNLKVLSSNHLLNIRISTCSTIKCSPFKPQEAQQHNSVLNKAMTTFKGSPYVRLMRLDRPIGKNQQHQLFSVILNFSISF